MDLKCFKPQRFNISKYFFSHLEKLKSDRRKLRFCVILWTLLVYGARSFSKKKHSYQTFNVN